MLFDNMRFILTFFIWLIIVGGLWTYIHYRDNDIPATVNGTGLITADASVTIEITPTFNLERDPFALQSEIAETGLMLHFNSINIAVLENNIQRGKTYRLENIKGLVHEQNNIFFQASPPLSESSLEQAVRIRVFINNTPTAEQTFWAGQGARISGNLRFTYLPEKEAGHDH